MLNNFFIFLVALYLVIRGSTMATKYAGRLAESFRLPRYTVGFIVVAIISILPETFIALNSAIAGIPSFGLGMLFGASIADLTLIFAIIVFYARRNLWVESKTLKNQAAYPFILLLPLTLGLDGYFSRAEGAVLVLACVMFYYIALRESAGGQAALSNHHHDERLKSISILLASMAILLLGSHFTVNAALSVANHLRINPILVGMLVVGLGTTMPELFFSLRSIKKKDDSLAIGDLLGTVLANATIVVGILALIQPFAFPSRIIYVTGSFMVLASFLIFRFMRSGHALTRREATMLLAFWFVFVIVEFWTSS